MDVYDFASPFPAIGKRSALTLRPKQLAMLGVEGGPTPVS